MDYGFSIPHRGPLARPDAIMTLARKGEELGFGYLTVSDHIVIPRTMDSKYPYSETGEFPGSRSGEAMEQLALLSFLAGITSKIRLLTSVMVVPHRPPVFTAKNLATVDVLSKGRLSVGCGVGWLEEEFEAIGAPPFRERGRVSDEYLQVFKELWTSDNPAFDGRYAHFSDVSALPKPVQRPHPPIWIGGESGPALRRAARLGDCWYPIGNNPRQPLDTAERYRAALSSLRQIAEQEGRDPSTIDLAYSAPWHREQAETGPDGERRIFTGGAEQVAGDIDRFAEMGVRHLFLNFAAGAVEGTVERLQNFMENVAPLVER